jgi:hypothetical protein
MVAGLGGMACVLLVMLMPLYGEIQTTLHFFLTQTEIGSTINRLKPSTPEASTSALLQDALGRMQHFIKLILRTPFIWAGVAIGCFYWRKHRFHFAALLLCSAIVIMTQVYHARVNYLTPLAFLFFTEGLGQCLKQARPVCVRYLAMAFLAAALTYSFLLSVIALNYFARPLTQGNTYDALLEKMAATIGRGPKHIYTFTYDIYHVGRKLGWHLFAFLPGRPETLFNLAVSKQLLADLDYLVVGDDYTLSASQAEFLNEHGFRPWQRVELPVDQPVGITARFRPIIYARGYPSFTVWERTVPVQQAATE